MSLTDAIWQAIQRPSPAVTRDEIEALIMEWTQAPTADETIGSVQVQNMYSVEPIDDPQWSREQLLHIEAKATGKPYQPRKIPSVVTKEQAQAVLAAAARLAEPDYLYEEYKLRDPSSVPAPYEPTPGDTMDRVSAQAIDSFNAIIKAKRRKEPKA